MTNEIRIRVGKDGLVVALPPKANVATIKAIAKEVEAKLHAVYGTKKLKPSVVYPEDEE